jgi:predicted nucleotidyltransferase
MILFREYLKALHDHGVDFVVIGGVAGALHGSPVATFDLDLCTTFDEANLAKILAALRPLDPRIRDRPDKMRLPEDIERLKGLKNLCLTTTLGNIDFLGELPGIGPYAEIRGRSVEMDVGGFCVRVLDLETLIAAKKVANRDKDRIAVRHLEAIQSYMRKNQKLFE